jgi:hypothetical protein
LNRTTKKVFHNKNTKVETENFKNIDDDNPLMIASGFDNPIDNLRTYIYNILKSTLRNNDLIDREHYVNELKRVYFSDFFDREIIGRNYIESIEKDPIYWQTIKLLSLVLKSKNIKLIILSDQSTDEFSKRDTSEFYLKEEKKYFSFGISYLSLKNTTRISPQDLDLNPITFLRRDNKYNLIGKLKIANALLIKMSKEEAELGDYKSSTLSEIIGNEIAEHQSVTKILPWADYIEQRRMDYYYKWFLGLSPEKHSYIRTKNLDHLTYYYREVLPFIENERLNKNHDIEEGGLGY